MSEEQVTHGDGPDQERRDRELAERLDAQRPIPTAGFRGALGRHLAVRDPGYGPRPSHLRPMVAAYSAGGLLLMLVGTLQATGTL